MWSGNSSSTKQLKCSISRIDTKNNSQYFSLITNYWSFPQAFITRLTFYKLEHHNYNKNKNKNASYIYIYAKILRSGVADYVIFLITLYDITFQWWSNTHNSNQNLSLSMSFLKKLLNPTPTSSLFLLLKFHHKGKLKKWCDFGGFQLPQLRERNTKTCQLLEGWLKFCNSYLVYRFIARFG
jgi:hypothetical protein